MTGRGLIISVVPRLIFSLYTTGQLEAGDPVLVFTVLAEFVSEFGNQRSFLLPDPLFLTFRVLIEWKGS